MRTGLSEKTPSAVPAVNATAPDHAAVTAEGADGEPIQLLTPEGVRVESPEYDSWVDDLTNDDLLAIYEDMVVVRRFDNEATALQRQGQLGLWPPSLGQEAAQIGSARACVAMTSCSRATASTAWPTCAA